MRLLEGDGRLMADGNFSEACDNAHAIGQLEGRKMLEGKEGK